ncbi:V-type ATP synthase subunit A [Halomonas elongata]|uniref:V-type ATP synthase alpha chain n=1 Tax=Halomonas elongata (strain ATCC 33173 / DSM 2581 / NBRC 15536 / NCIMB 2198 / 1H9) TaxID=768066 RepID=E1V372_HALED|nr:V-type ATP synthase subunit A [Halomonas elongata]WBF19846.1 V-type ATP synthase subunit A [Halomonas elongata]WPU48716.1 V-type ATP synthase subunit A [Halomonas elongata DSM 2581]CBV42551.2 V-type ATP synthase subunit A [Halomonas elongata DSM 2581]
MTQDTVASMPAATARVVAINEDVVTIELDDDATGCLIKNEVVYICPPSSVDRPRTLLKAEVLSVKGNEAEAQVYEDTRNVGVGDPVIQSGQQLTVELGPGLLGQVYDGLQNPLPRLLETGGTFLQRGLEVRALDDRHEWSFEARVRSGDEVMPGDTLGVVQEGRFSHRIFVPFALQGTFSVAWIQAGSFTIDTVVARLTDEAGNEHPITMTQRWPVRHPLSQELVSLGRAERRYPEAPLTTTLRLIDTFFPIAKGGTACIPGPFGAGKTVLQNLISRYSDVDIVIIVACGERAGEVVETITEFPQLADPHTGGSLMDRTIIVCNTSSMPVAAREASIHTGTTLGEYYRQMGYDVLLIADSTSRWAQAMRETSGRLEEIPGEEAFPAYLESSIRKLYERAGILDMHGGQCGSLTLIGTVSPAGGNFEEPVTQGTLNTVKTFLGLSYDRAYKRFYPAVDPLISWSRYPEQLSGWFRRTMGEHWQADVDRLKALLHEGDEIERMMQVTGEEGISDADFLSQQKATLVDMVYLQQDAFDKVDASTSLNRQKAAMALLTRIVDAPLSFGGKQDIRDVFTRLTDLFRNLNYAEFESDNYWKIRHSIDELLKQYAREASRTAAYPASTP